MCPKLASLQWLESRSGSLPVFLGFMDIDLNFSSQGSARLKADLPNATPLP